MAIGTICWIATVIALGRVRSYSVLTHLRAEIQLQTFRGSSNWLSDISIYVRLILYELVALAPACVLVIPFEVAMHTHLHTAHRACGQAHAYTLNEGGTGSGDRWGHVHIHGWIRKAYRHEVRAALTVIQSERSDCAIALRLVLL